MATVKPEDQAAAKAAAEAKAKADAEAAAKAQATANKNVTVTFTKPHSRYSRGDVAGFPEDRAKHLVEGIKVAVKGDKLPAAKAE
tara:strand:+ start:4713 stop:4967 length:255 start_codon:yes stop_codon:yes gene_type:complete